MAGWKHAWESVAAELGLQIEKSDLFDRPTLMQGVVDGVPLRIAHFAERGDEKARLTVGFGTSGPPPGLVMKRRTSGHWKMAPQLHPRHRRVGLWELWSNDDTQLDEWLTEERQRAIMHLDPTVDVTHSAIVTVIQPAGDAAALLRGAKRIIADAAVLAGEPPAFQG